MSVRTSRHITDVIKRLSPHLWRLYQRAESHEGVEKDAFVHVRIQITHEKISANVDLFPVRRCLTVMKATQSLGSDLLLPSLGILTLLTLIGLPNSLI